MSESAKPDGVANEDEFREAVKARMRGIPSAEAEKVAWRYAELLIDYWNLANAKSTKSFFGRVFKSRDAELDWSHGVVNGAAEMLDTLGYWELAWSIDNYGAHYLRIPPGAPNDGVLMWRVQ